MTQGQRRQNTVSNGLTDRCVRVRALGVSLLNHFNKIISWFYLTSLYIQFHSRFQTKK